MLLSAILTTPSILVALVASAPLIFVLYRVIYNLYFHPLAKFPGPWYAASSSLVLALISVSRVEPQWLLSLTKKYGTSQPIRISPTLLLFPRPSALAPIYRNPVMNTKSGLYGTGVLGPPHLFTTLDADAHRDLRKALGGPHWSIGALKTTWEPAIDQQVLLLCERLREKAARNEPVCLSDKCAEFAADIMTLLSFSRPWGFVHHGRDERRLLASWREGLDFFGFAGRWRTMREGILKTPWLARWFLPTMGDGAGMGYLIAEADRQVREREREAATAAAAGMKPEAEKEEQKDLHRRKDFLQHCLDARHPRTGHPLDPTQTRAHATLLIQAGADTTGTALGSALRFLHAHPAALHRCQTELAAADAAGLLTTPVQYDEVRRHLPFLVACLKESLRLQPPATNLFARLVPPARADPVEIDDALVPPGAEVTSYAYVVQRDPVLYGPDAEAWRPERWLAAATSSEEELERLREMEAASFTFGMGPRVCLGKDVAWMELAKVVAEVVRVVEPVEVLGLGEYVVAGGVAYNRGFEVRLRVREGK